jgi:hypothetical protein
MIVAAGQAVHVQSSLLRPAFALALVVTGGHAGRSAWHKDRAARAAQTLKKTRRQPE